MFLKTPYESRTLEAFDKLDLTLLVNRYIIQDFGYYSQHDKLLRAPFKKGNEVIQSVVLYGLSDVEKDIPEFQYPLMDKKGKWIAFDMRPFYTVDRREQTVMLKARYEAQIQTTINIISGLWAVGFNRDLYQFSFPHKVFAKWIANLIVKKVDIDVGAAIDIEVLAMIYYSRLFLEKNEREDERDKLLVRFKETYYNQGIFDRVYDMSKEMETLEDFCNLIPMVSGSSRLNNFSIDVLYPLVGNSWMGSHNRKMVQISLEYPPIFLGLVQHSIKSRSYSNSIIGQTAMSVGKRGDVAADFAKSLTLFLAEHYGV